MLWNKKIVDISYETLTFDSVLDYAISATGTTVGLPPAEEENGIGSTGLEDNTAGSSGLGSLAKKCGLQ